ncbi:hypothetical protein B0A48_10958 [Cryoendolithus antarcticus]|uniref:Translocator protein n=1 Tax=Cryoendolithus antarcticus TaxID=1507870 RepID=A0A1V8SYV5_9PEZI|nr:hypothetical protein B0A48_10958 [Cryoendolithus antarcticus]
MTTYIPSLTLPAFIFENAAASILLPILLGTASGYVITRPDKTKQQYGTFKKPVGSESGAENVRRFPGNPPAWLFGPAWTALYGFTGLSAHLAWTNGANSLSPATSSLAKQGATLYTIQLGLNMLFMPLFFGYNRPVEALVDIVTLTGLNGWLIYVWGQVDQRSGWLLAPYLGWLSFATYLCAGTGYLNDWDLRNNSKPTIEKKD